MQTTGAIIRSAPGEFELVELTLDPPRRNEILVEMKATGLCHSDVHVAAGDHAVSHYPLCGGHEGAGVVAEVGPHTDGWQVGDHVVFSFLAACGRCRWCASGHQNLCDRGAAIMTGGRPDGSGHRMSLDGAPVAQMCGLGTFSRYTTVHVDSAVKVPTDLPLDRLCLLGCGVGTGWGAAVNSAAVRPGQTVIVVGVGGVGINAVQGAAHAGAGVLIAVDPVEFKRGSALDLGATHAVATLAEAAEIARAHTNGQGADAVIVAAGQVTGEIVAESFAAIRKAGVCVVVGLGRPTDPPPQISMFELVLYEKRLQGSLFGSSNPTADIPWLIEMYRRGQLDLDTLVTRTYPLAEIGRGFADLAAGQVLRPVVVFD